MALQLGRCLAVQTGVATLRMCFVTPVIPYALSFSPQLLIGQGDFSAALFALAVIRLGVVAFTLTAVTPSYSVGVLRRIERGIILAPSIALVAP